jgi:hypothetical protein
MPFALFANTWDWINRVMGPFFSRGAATWGSKVYLSDSDIKLLWYGSSGFSWYVDNDVDQRLNAISTLSFTTLDYTAVEFGSFMLLACLNDLGHVCTSNGGWGWGGRFLGDTKLE